MGHRPDLNALTAVERTNLVNLILPYLTDAVVAAHTTINHSGEHLFTGHRAYIEDLEAYLLANGGSQFVPLSKWNPANPIPEEFNVVKAEDDSTPRPPLENLNPNMPLPSKFAEPMLCEYKDADTLGSDVSGWHGNVHTMVGGTMGQFSIASAAPFSGASTHLLTRSITTGNIASRCCLLIRTNGQQSCKLSLVLLMTGADLALRLVGSPFRLIRGVHCANLHQQNEISFWA